MVEIECQDGTGLANPETDDSSLLSQYVDHIVIPGMAIKLPDIKKEGTNSTWSFGSGVSFIPALRTKLANRKRRRQTDGILIRQFGVLKHKSEKQPAASGVPTTDRKVKPTTTNHTIWLERPTLTVTTDGGVPCIAGLTRQRYPCNMGDFRVGDRVVGVVMRRMGDNYLVDVGGPSSAVINYLSFEGASKKNRADLRSGDVLYSLITQADRDLDLELSCVDEAGKACGMGILGRHEPGTVGNAGGMAGGVMLHCSPQLVRRLADDRKFPLLSLLAKVFPFEVCLGVNGRIWLTTRSAKETVLLANVITMAEHVPAEVCCQLAARLS